jgi:hypothetical protein
MDVASIATSLIAAKAGQTQTVLSARMMKMNAQADAALLGLLQDAASQGAGAIASPSSGTGRRLDITV